MHPLLYSSRVGLNFAGMKLLIPSLLLVSAFATAGQIVSATVIDDFSQGALFVQVTNYAGQTLYQNGLSTSDVIGGSRSTYAGTVGLATAEIDTSAGTFRFSSDSSFGYFTLTYGATTPLGANLLADGSDRFLVSIAQVTTGLWRSGFFFGVETGGTWRSYSFGGDLTALDGSGVVTIPFSRFPGADMADVQAIGISASRFEPNRQIIIDSVITTVPEPSSLPFLAAGLGALAFVSKRAWGT
jgi:hypothetical protein